MLQNFCTGCNKCKNAKNDFAIKNAENKDALQQSAKAHYQSIPKVKTTSKWSIAT